LQWSKAFCSQLANSDWTTSLANNNTTADMQKESRSCDSRVLGFAWSAAQKFADLLGVGGCTLGIIQKL